MYIYSWSGNGNLGDDWIQEVGLQYFPSALRFEDSKLKFFNLAFFKNRLVPQKTRGHSLLIWGGGWIASDQKKYKTMRRWANHLRRFRKVYIFGSGMGPFEFDLTYVEKFFSSASGTIYTRSSIDRPVSYPNFRLSCDIAFLDKRMTIGNFSTNQPRANKFACSFPAWSERWLEQNPNLDEDKYKNFVVHLVQSLDPHREGLFVEFDAGGSGVSDSDYWSCLGLTVQRTANIMEAKSLIEETETFAAGRLHAGILAAMSGCKVVAIGYHHKFDILSEIGVYVEKSLDMPFSTMPIKANVSEIYKVRDRVHRALEQFILENQGSLLKPPLESTNRVKV